MSGSAPKKIYPAVRSDVSAIKNSFDPDYRFERWMTDKKPNIMERVLMFTFFAIDVPVSAVTDTIFLPIDLQKKDKDPNMRLQMHPRSGEH